MPSHRVLVQMQSPDQAMLYPGDLIDYEGRPDWKIEPLDPIARDEWEASTADPERVETELRRQGAAGCFPDGESVLPTGMTGTSGPALPPSGPPTMVQR